MPQPSARNVSCLGAEGIVEFDDMHGQMRKGICSGWACRNIFGGHGFNCATVLPCERCSSIRSELATGSLVDAGAAAGAWQVEWKIAQPQTRRTRREQRQQEFVSRKAPWASSIYRQRWLSHLRCKPLDTGITENTGLAKNFPVNPVISVV